MAYKVLGKLVGNTGDASQLTMVVQDSFSVRRGEFVRIMHQERKDEGQVAVLGRVTKISRTNMLYNAGFGDGVTELELLPGANVTGENMFAQVELVGYRDPVSRQIKIPRRPLNPGTAVETVDFQFLSDFYEFNEHSSLHLGNLVGYDKGENTVPVFIDVNKLVTEHMAVLAMTGSGKSYTVGRIIERLVAVNNGTVVVFDPHGEYGKALAGGNLQFSSLLDATDDKRDQEALPLIKHTFEKLQAAGAGIKVFSPQHESFKHKYASKNTPLALQFDHFEMDDIAEILPGLSEPQQRVLDVAIRYWRSVDKTEPRDINRLRYFLGDGIEELKEWDDLSEAEAKALSGRSAAVASMKLSRVLNEAQSFYSATMAEPTDIYKMVGRPSNQQGRLVVVDLQGLSDTAKQVVCALLSSEILKAASSKTDPLRPCFIVYEEGHNFAPAGGNAVSHRIIKKIAGEGRKFGVGFGIVSQRPSKLDSDVTSQCNTLITMRLKNPDDQRFIAKASDMVSKADLDELPSLSTGEALVCGRSIPAPLLVKVGSKALIHGGESPEVLRVWGSFNG
ncbi:ATP-binding protein [Vibrio sp. IRLE0018]|uniref:Helicase HerA domain-containing protein n=1 Tax=Pseudoalteromonas fenneropenaei TaxID=1737459 RepID=A0ABV7CP39_9GAMM|nr:MULTISPECIES: ATP-binding protein [Vibrio]EHK8986094.1 ATP-binding protein [Vibrio vulnificus]EID0691366.1 ATP-binding protein [Vibrio vulnificus]MBO1380991.1 nucleoside triphosphate hydrolase [Vibrio cholerae]MBO1388753.1 nucleoside triphosphate hydrolase [Vibrio cholerae]MBO1395218.1 nucleoside triphosphate hydrolase [Vibrio cholerae]